MHLRGRFLDLNIGSRFVEAVFQLASLFAANEQGVLFDPSDLSTLFTDAAGTIPVASPGDPVGLMLDKSQGLVLGPELVTNGGFDTATDWTATGGTLTIAGGTATLAGVDGPDPFFIGTPFAVSAGQSFVLEANIISSGGTPANNVLIRLRQGGGNFAGAVGVIVPSTTTGPQRAVVTIPAGWTSAEVAVQRGGNPVPATTTVVVDNISVKLLPGHHASQATAAKRPLYGFHPFGGIRNLLTRSEEFDNAVWGKIDATVTTNTAVAPDGTTTADTIAFNGTVAARVEQGVSVGSQVTFSVWLRVASGSVSVSIGTRASNIVAVTVTDEWQRFSMTAADSAFPRIRCDVATNVLAWGAQVEAGSTATAYQRVGSQYDVTEAGVASVHYLAFDGIDDSMATPAITPGTDKVQMFAGVRKLSDAAFAIIAETSTSISSNNGAAVLSATASAAGTNFFASKGTVVANVFGPVVSLAPVTQVSTGLGDVSGDIATLRVGGNQVAQTVTDQGTGGYLAYPLNIGARAGSSLYLNGNLYGLTVRFGPNLDAATIDKVEANLAGKSGVTL